MHKRVRGELPREAGRFPAGTPFAADDPELLLWILATLVDSALMVYERYVLRSRAPSATPTGGTTASSAGCSACATTTCPPTGAIRRLHGGHARSGDLSSRRPRASSPSRSSCARRCRSRSARSRAGELHHGRPAAVDAARGTASRGTRRARWRCAVAPSTPSACWSRCAARLRFVPGAGVAGRRTPGAHCIISNARVPRAPRRRASRPRERRVVAGGQIGLAVERPDPQPALGHQHVLARPRPVAAGVARRALGKRAS